jgi:hypothetical protein
MSSAEAVSAPEAPAWRRIALRTVGICGAAEATLVPQLLLVGWQMAPADVASLIGNQVLDFTCVGLIISLTLHAVERLGHWPKGWRYALLAVGLAAAVVMQLNWGAPNFFHSPGMHERVERAGIAVDPEAIRLHLTWFTAILASVSALYLLQRRESIEAEQRHVLLEAQLQQARRRVRILRDATGAARLDPRVLFDCMGLARREYLRDAPRGDALLYRLIDFLHGSVSATRSGPHTLGAEVDQALRFAAIPAQAGGVQIVDAVPLAMRPLEVCPGLLLPLVQQWLTTCAASSAGTDGQPLCIDASIEGEAERVLCIRLNGPAVAPEALLAEPRSRLIDLYGNQASAHAVLSETGTPQLDIRIELPLEPAHVD